MTKIQLYPRCAATIAKPTPVFPDVGSMMVDPGFRRPSFSAASTIAKAGLSLTLPPGFVVSTFAITGHGIPSVTRTSRTMGVRPIS